LKTRFVLLLLTILSLSLYGDDWTVGTGGKPARYGLSTELGPTDQTLLWQGGLPAVIARPAVIEGNIVAMDRIQDISDVLHGTKIVAHNLTTGETLWTKDLPVEFPSTDWRNRVSAIRDGKVYATRSGNTNASYLYALNVLTGEIIWRSQDLIDESSTEGISFASNGDLIVGNFTNIKRIDAGDGTTVWTSARSSPTSGGSEVAVCGGKGFAWEATGQGPRISVYNLDTGTRLYSSPGLGGLIQQVAPFVGPDGTVYATRTQNNTITDYLVAFADIDTALVEKWRIPLGYVPFSSFGVGPDGSVYSYSQSNRVIRIDSNNGSVKDSSEIILLEFPSQPRMAIDDSGLVFVTNGCFTNGALYSFNRDLSLRWSTPIPNVNIGGPAIGQGGTMVVCGVGTDVRAYHGCAAIIENKIIENLPCANLKVFPNPFHEKVNITLTSLNKGSSTNNSYLKIYDITGNLIKKISYKNSLPTNLVWDGRDYKGKPLTPGVYLLRFTIGYTSLTKKIAKN
jgi:outer membrane protein assembly factor BamB